MKNTINITNTASVTAYGTHTNGNCKEILDLTTGLIYTSMTDTAMALDCSIDAVSNVIRGTQKTCKGHELCLLTKANEYLPNLTGKIVKQAQELSELAELKAKAKAYDKMMEELEKTRKAKEKHDADVAKADAKVARRLAICERLQAQLLKAEKRLMDAEAELNALKGNGKEVK